MKTNFVHPKENSLVFSLRPSNLGKLIRGFPSADGCDLSNSSRMSQKSFHGDFIFAAGVRHAGF